MAKFTLEFTDQAAEVVRALSRQHETSQSEIVRKSINLMKYVEDQRGDGAEILVRTKDGTLREIVPI